MQDRKTKPRPFENSLRALAQVAMHETGADGFAFFRKDAETSTVVLCEAGGASIPEEAIPEGAVAEGNADLRLIAYTLANDGIVAFAFPDEARSGAARPQLDRAAVAIKAVSSAARSSSRYAQLASQAGRDGDRKMRTRPLLVAACSVFAMPAMAGVTGSISGTVKDSSGGIVPGATVEPTNSAQGIRNRTTIDSKGFYTFPRLPVGGYRLEFELHGFRQQRRTGLVIDADSALIEDATLRSPKERKKSVATIRSQC
jgi:hypothetical protein